MTDTPRTVLGVALGLALFASPAFGQLKIIPQAGLYASVSDLGTVDTPEGIRTVGEQQTSFAYGLTLEFSSNRPLQLRISGLYGSDSEVPVGGVGCSGTACDVRSTLLAVAAGLRISPFPRDFPFRPHLFGGGGMKRYDFRFEADSQLKDAFGDESLASWLLGVGFDWNLGFLKGNLELADYVSDSVLPDGDRQHDLFLTLGLVLG